MAVFPIASFLVVLFLGLCIILHALPTGCSTLGFSAELIHRDSPESPLYDPTSTLFSRIRDAVHRSAALANHFGNVHASANSNPRLNTIHAVNDDKLYFDGISYLGTYLAKLRLGTPMQTAFVGVSTTGSFSWVACNPCKGCGKKNTPLFNPNASTTNSIIPCLSGECKPVRRFPSCSGENNHICKYEQRYGRYINVSGILSTETIHFQNETSVPGIIFGCTHEIVLVHNNENIAKNKLGIGFMGLNDHSHSFINQLYYRTGEKLPLKFAYCFPGEDSKFSRIYFGYTPPYKGFFITPLTIGPFSNLYYLNLQMIEMIFKNNEHDNLNVTVKQEKGLNDRSDGNILMDSATQVTFLEDVTLNRLKDSILGAKIRRRVPVPKDLEPIIEVCLDWTKPDKSVLPTLFFSFENKAIILTSDVFVEVKEGVLCLFMASANKFSAGVQIFGNRPQINHHFEFDLKKKVVSIHLNLCARQK